MYDGENIIIGATLDKGGVFIYKQTNTQNDTNGVISVEDHTTHELYLNGEKVKVIN